MIYYILLFLSFLFHFSRKYYELLVSDVEGVLAPVTLCFQLNGNRIGFIPIFVSPTSAGNTHRHIFLKEEQL